MHSIVFLLKIKIGRIYFINSASESIGAHNGNRTHDLFLTKKVLYQLSYVSGSRYEYPTRPQKSRKCVPQSSKGLSEENQAL